eukprot:6438854-Prymnesium_polylepis.1
MKQTPMCCGAGVTTLTGHASSLADLEMVVTSGTATITLTGPDGVWFGVGYAAGTRTIAVSFAPRFNQCIDGGSDPCTTVSSLRRWRTSRTRSSSTARAL